MSAQVTINELKPGMELPGKVKHIELYGAFVDIGVGTDALLHISQLGRPNVRNVEDVVKVGEDVTVYVLKVDKDANRIALSLVKPPSVTWDSLKEGDTVEGEVVRVETFGAFIDIGAERPGMVHVSELKDGYVKSPSDVVSVGERVQARILKINRKKRQIDLTMKEQREEVAKYEEEPQEELPTAMALALRKAMEMSDKGGDDEAAKRESGKNKKRSQQDDIIARTLRQHQN